MSLIHSAQGSYSRLITRNNPGLIILLLDQSSSMGEPLGSSTKATEATKAVNRMIYEIALKSRSGAEIAKRCFVGVIGYGEAIKPIVGGIISDVYNTPLRRETIYRDDGYGGLMESPMPIWVDPVAKNGTPMADAFNTAYPLVDAWINEHPDIFPPVVINITDGEPNDFDKSTSHAPATEAAARKLAQLRTSDGNVLIFNAHISNTTSTLEIKLPSTMDSVSNVYARMLFNISSIIPTSLQKDAQMFGFSVSSGSRGFVFNAGAETLIKLLAFGSSTYKR